VSRAPTQRERQHVVEALHRAVAAGTLHLPDFERQLTATLHAPTLAECERLAAAWGVSPLRMELRGSDGVAVLEGDRVILTFAAWSTLDVKKVRSPRVIPLTAIAAVEFAPRWVGGDLRFRLAGEAPSYEPPRPKYDANTLQLDPSERESSEAFAAELSERIALQPRVPEPQLLPPQHRLPGLPPPPPGELFVQLQTHSHVVTLDENGVLIERRWDEKPSRWLPLTAIAAVEFDPGRGFRSGTVRFVLAGLPAGFRRPAPDDDPDGFTFTSNSGDAGTAEDLAAHVAARITRPRVVEPSLLPGNHPADWGSPGTVPLPSPPSWTPPPAGDAPTQLRELARLRAEGLITDADYEAKKQEILRRW
jgi:hypothetical protein